MIDLKELNRIYKEKEKIDLRLLTQLKLIRKVLGNNFTYKDFEYIIPDTILTIDDNTTTENKVIVEHTAPTGDSMNNTLKLFALSVLGLGFVLLYRKKITG